MVERNEIRANLERIRERIARAAQRAARKPDEITLVAVSKRFPVEAIRIAYDAGLRHFGENRVQEWEGKQPKLTDLDATWHLIGHLQSNKARRAAYLFRRIDSLDDLALAKKLDAAAAAEGKNLPVLIEVHLGEETSKSGAAPDDLAALAESIAPFAHLDLVGLMTIPPFSDEAERAGPFFRRLRELRDGVSARIGRKLPVLSMGMSHDFEIAIEEGATEIRLGTALFGARPPAA
ncbi:MAG TPA: YggS family pyridoxal phosphate-dependent enzyme [Candidatus Limnocylindrales bacterium]|nr:YggS family pyridoxal phosphate-dependent enzyme [Candidatus Limnocylindrales bacterium]